MGLVTTTEAKLHLRVTNTSEDSLIALFIEAATEHIRKYLNRDVPGETSDPVDIPFSIKAACLLIIADLYENREAQTADKNLNENKTVTSLLYPYRENIGI